LETITPEKLALILKQCRKGDRKAQLLLYKTYYKAMYNTAYRILKNANLAEDAMQEAFLDAFRKLDQYDGRSTFGYWLKRIVKHNSLDLLRKEKSFTSLESEWLAVQEERGQEPDYLEILALKADIIRDTIMNLPDEKRIILSLYLIEGYDHEEISYVLGLSHAAVRTRYSRAKNALVQILSENKLNQIINNN